MAADDLDIGVMRVVEEDFSPDSLVEGVISIHGQSGHIVADSVVGHFLPSTHD